MEILIFTQTNDSYIPFLVVIAMNMMTIAMIASHPAISLISAAAANVDFLFSYHQIYFQLCRSAENIARIANATLCHSQLSGGSQWLS